MIVYGDKSVLEDILAWYLVIDESTDYKEHEPVQFSSVSMEQKNYYHYDYARQFDNRKTNLKIKNYFERFPLLRGKSKKRNRKK